MPFAAGQKKPRRNATHRWIARVIVVVGVVAGAFAFIYLWRPAILMGTPTKAIEYSVSGETVSPWAGDCTRSGAGRLTCLMSTSSSNALGQLVVEHLDILVSEPRCRRAIVRDCWGANGRAERKARAVARPVESASARRTSCVPICGSHSNAPRTSCAQRIPSAADAGVVGRVESIRPRRRQHAVVCLVLGVLRRVLCEPVW